MKQYGIIFMLFMLSGCTKVKIEPEFSALQKRTIAATGSSIALDATLHTHINDISNITNITQEGLSTDDAVSIALQNNPELQADFQNLGIAKADLVQASLYTNPSINSVFRFPTRDQGPGTAQTNIESVAAIRLSDLWQVPLATHVAEDLLEAVSFRIFSTILTVVAETKLAYYTCLAAELQLHNTTNLLVTIRELKDEIYYRQLYGYTSDLDKDRIDAQVGSLEALLQQRQAEVSRAYIHLKKLMGIIPSPQPIPLTGQLYNQISVPELSIMEEYALLNRPEIHVARMKIEQYRDTIRLEKAKIFKVIDVGIGYKQDFDKPFRGWGPYVSLTLPIFDDNYAQVARAEFLFKQAESDLAATKIRIQEEINKPYKILNALNQEITVYQNTILPSHQKAISYSYTYATTLQLTMVTAIESKIKFYEAQAALIDRYYHALKELVQLERAVGKKIELLHENIVVNDQDAPKNHVV